VADPLAQSLAAGAPTAFAELYDRLASRLVKTARRMGCHTTETEDIVHDLFVTMARSRANFAAVDNLDAYVFTALRHAVARHQQRRRLEHAAHSRVAEKALQRDGGAAATGPSADESLALALASLPPEQREVVALKIDGGLKFAEIGEVTGISPNTAASRYRYALEKLRGLLIDTCVKVGENAP
jgi:RNA polymerase sigma-70 factor (ECF subfamily)